MAFVFENERFSEKIYEGIEPLMAHTQINFRQNKVPFNTGAPSILTPIVKLNKSSNEDKLKAIYMAQDKRK